MMTDTGTRQLLLTGLKTDLGMSATTRFDDRLIERLIQAEEELTAQGITLQDTSRDRELVIMYAAWLWRSRTDGAPMPRMLKIARNNRLAGEKAAIE